MLDQIKPGMAAVYLCLLGVSHTGSSRRLACPLLPFAFVWLLSLAGLSATHHRVRLAAHRSRRTRNATLRLKVEVSWLKTEMAKESRVASCQGPLFSRSKLQLLPHTIHPSESQFKLVEHNKHDNLEVAKSSCFNCSQRR